jgi:hypothetical protein
LDEIKEALDKCYDLASLSSNNQEFVISSCVAAFLLSQIGEFRQGKIVKFLRPYGYYEPVREEPRLPWPMLPKSDATSGEVVPKRDDAGAAPAITGSTNSAEIREE